MSRRGLARLIVAAFYLGSIPGFAAIYTYRLPGQFYHSTLIRESVFGDKRRAIERDLNQAVYKQWNETPTPHHSRSRVVHFPKMQSWLIDLTKIENIIINQNTISFTVPAEVMSGDFKMPSNIALEEYGISHPSLGVMFNFDDVRDADDLNDGVPLKFTILPDAEKVFLDDAAKREFENALFPSLRSQNEMLRVPKATITLIKDYSAANEGIDLEKSDNYWRMLYFSATTVTTLGFGDIVPMTPAARAWSAIEAVVGVVLIGVFLNLLAPGSKNRKMLTDS